MDSDSLPIGNALLALLVIGIVISAFAFGLKQFSEMRGWKIVTKVEKELRPFIEKNQGSLEKLLAVEVGLNDSCYNDINTVQNYVSEFGITEKTRILTKLTKCDNLQLALAEIDSSTLENNSSLWYLKKIDGKYLLIHQSGNTNELYDREHIYKTLDDLFDGKKDRIQWGDYTWETEKEVVIPIKKDGKVIGAIVRGVIE